MTKYRIPVRLGTSPASEEPGLQNAAARLRSSRDVQSRILAERRGAGGSGIVADVAPETPPADLVAGDGIPGKREGEGASVAPKSPVTGKAKAVAGKKVKVVIVFRLALALQPEIEDLARREGLERAYVLAAFAREGRAVLRGLADGNDLAAFIDDAAAFRALGENAKSVGVPRTVYVREDGLGAMHNAMSDPWQMLPRASVVGAFFAAILTRLVRVRREG